MANHNTEWVRCIDCLRYNDKHKPYGCRYSGARIPMKTAKTRLIQCSFYIDENIVKLARAGWRGHAAGVHGKVNRQIGSPSETRTFNGMIYELMNGNYGGHARGCNSRQSAERMAADWKADGTGNTRIIKQNGKYWVYSR